MRIDIMKHLQTLYDLGPKYAEAKGQRVMLEESLKVAKAESFIASDAQTVAQKEASAITSKEYATAIKGLSVAIENEERLKRALITAEAAVEVWRSLESSRRTMDKAAS